MAGIITKIKYPKLIIIFLTYILAYLIFNQKGYLPFHNLLLAIGYLGTFIAGFFYVYEFTVAPAAAILLLLGKEQNILLAVVVGGFGALLSDVLLFYLIRTGVRDEILKISKTPLIRFIKKEENILFGKFKKYVLFAFAGFMIASPLPTEIGVSILSVSKNISPRKFVFITYVLHTIGILAVLLIGNLI